MKIKILAIAAVLLVAACLYAAHTLTTSSLPELEDGLVFIPQGLGLEEIAAHFFGSSPLHGWVFKIHVLLSGKSRRLKAGEYQLKKDSIRSLTLKLVAGRVHAYRLTVKEGVWSSDIAMLLESAGLADRGKLLALIHDRAFVRKVLGFDAPNLEGYLFPETYFFTKGMKEEEILAVFVRRFREKTGLLPDAGPPASDTVHAAVILASMVEREAKADEERPTIAGVFLNRLEKRMHLESCVTVEYALGQKKKILTEKDLGVASPYNTYRHYGLPPGPVSNPGLASIRAVLAPSKTRALFFVAQGDGRHIFSQTWPQHLQAKKKVRQKSRAGLNKT